MLRLLHRLPALLAITLVNDITSGLLDRVLGFSSRERKREFRVGQICLMWENVKN